MTYRQLGNCKYNVDIPPPINVNKNMEICLKTQKINSISSPKTWGPAFWFINHLGSVSAPKIIPLEKREKYWGFIDGIPEMLACGKCKQHAREYVDSHRIYKDIICSSRDNLVKFFVDFHNSVNIRNNKPTITHDEIYRMFSGPVEIKHFSYE